MRLPLEIINTIASVGTLLVVAAAAFAAIVQLRHLRAANLLTAFLEFNDRWSSSEYVQARHFIRHELPERIRTAEFQRNLPLNSTEEARHVILILDYFELAGLLVKRGVLDKNIFLDAYGYAVVREWERLHECTALLRAQSPAAFVNFEYLYVTAQVFIAKSDAEFPKGVRRADLPTVPPVRESASQTSLRSN
jgi:hypothetical protein